MDMNRGGRGGRQRLKVLLWVVLEVAVLGGGWDLEGR